MSGHGIRITNTSGELTFSSDARGLYCLGKGVLQGAVVQASGVATNPFPGRVCGYSTYRFTGHSGPLVFAIDMPLGRNVGIRAVSSPAANTFDVQVYCGDTPDGDGFETQYAVDVWAFGLPQSAPSGWGMAIYDGAGAVAWDLTRQPLYAKAYIAGATGELRTIPSLTRPVLVGARWCDIRTDGRDGGANTHKVIVRTGCMQRTSSTTVQATSPPAQQWRYFSPDDVIGGDGDDTNFSSFIIEGALLP